MLANAWLSPPIRLSSFDGTTMAIASVLGTISNSTTPAASRIARG